MILHPNKLKNKNHMTLSRNAEKDFDKIQHAFLIKKNLQKVVIEGRYLNIMKAISLWPQLTSFSIVKS